MSVRLQPVYGKVAIRTAPKDSNAMSQLAGFSGTGGKVSAMEQIAIARIVSPVAELVLTGHAVAPVTEHNYVAAYLGEDGRSSIAERSAAKTRKCARQIQAFSLTHRQQRVGRPRIALTQPQQTSPTLPALTAHCASLRYDRRATATASRPVISCCQKNGTH